MDQVLTKPTLAHFLAVTYLLTQLVIHEKHILSGLTCQYVRWKGLLVNGSNIKERISILVCHPLGPQDTRTRLVVISISGYRVGGKNGDRKVIGSNSVSQSDTQSVMRKNAMNR